jgi:hypothetical protein
MNNQFVLEYAIREGKNHLFFNNAFVHWLDNLMPGKNNERPAFNHRTYNVTITPKNSDTTFCHSSSGFNNGAI